MIPLCLALAFGCYATMAAFRAGGFCRLMSRWLAHAAALSMALAFWFGLIDNSLTALWCEYRRNLKAARADVWQQ